MRVEKTRDFIVKVGYVSASVEPLPGAAGDRRESKVECDMHKLLRQAAYLLLLGVISVYAAGAIILVAVVFVGAIALDAVLAGWTRSPAQRRDRVSFLDAPDLAQRWNSPARHAARTAPPLPSRAEGAGVQP